MKDNLLRIVGILLAVAAVYILLPDSWQGFKLFDKIVFPIDDSLVSIERNIANALSYALWENRFLDAILLGLLLFLASACCAAMLGTQDFIEK